MVKSPLPLIPWLFPPSLVNQGTGIVFTLAKQEWIFNSTDQKWQNKIKMSARQISAHKTYYLLMRFPAAILPTHIPEIKTHFRDQNTQKQVDSKSWTISPNAAVPLRLAWAVLHLTGASQGLV